MQLPDIPQEQTGGSESGDSNVSRNEMSLFPHRVYHIHNGIVFMRVRKFTNEVHTDDVPVALWSGERMRYGQIAFYRTFTYQVPITLLISYIFNSYIFHIYLLPFISLKNHFIIEIDALQPSLTALDPYQDNFLNKPARLPHLGRLEAALSHSIACNSFRNGLQITNKSRQHTYTFTFHSRTLL